MAPSPTDAEVIAAARARAPISSASDDLLTAWLPWVRSVAGLPGWPTYAKRLDGQAWLLAHRAEVFLRDTSGGSSTGGGGSIVGGYVSRSEGPRSVGYGVGGGASGAGGLTPAELDLTSTASGRAFLALRATLSPAKRGTPRVFR